MTTDDPSTLSTRTMSRPGTDDADEPMTVPQDAANRYRDELAAASRHLQTEPSELARLLAFIDEKNVPRRQVPELLEQAHAQLTELRRMQAELAALPAASLDAAPLLARARAALEPGETLSLDRADEALEKAFRQCIERDAEPRLAAGIRAQQARIGVVRQDYRRATALFCEAAATQGLGGEQQWRCQFERAAVLEQIGRAFMDDQALAEAIDLCESAVIPLAPRETRPEDWAAAQNRLGTALGTLGRRQRGTAMLERALAAFERALGACRRERAPLLWATLQNNLGNALGALGQRCGDEDMLQRALAAFEGALEERTLERTPRDWAATQNNLGAVLLTLGQRNKEARLLEQAVDAYKAVLQVWTRDRLPLAWATTLDNIGTALRVLGEGRSGTRTLEQAVAAYTSALAERTRERAPEDWAMTQNNLGAALQRLGERQDDPALLGRAVHAYESALEEWTRERTPGAWAMTMANLGVARRMLAQRSADAAAARRAVADLEAVLEVFRGASHARYYELAEEQLNEARAVAERLGAA